MKEKYEAPKLEKLDFDYTDVVAASNATKYNNDPNGQYYKCSNEGYYAAGWGQNC